MANTNEGIVITCAFDYFVLNIPGFKTMDDNQEINFYDYCKSGYCKNSGCQYSTMTKGELEKLRNDLGNISIY